LDGKVKKKRAKYAENLKIFSIEREEKLPSEFKAHLRRFLELKEI
jgi:hypothetical protein